MTESTAGLASFYGGAFFRFGGDLQAAAEAIGMLAPRAILFVALSMLALLAVGLYRPHQRASWDNLLMRLVTAICLAGAANAVFSYLVPALSTGRGSLALALLINFIALCMIRASFLLVVDSTVFKRRVLVIGTGQRARSIAMLRRRSDQRNFRIVGYLRSGQDSADHRIDHPAVSREAIRQFVTEHAVDEIVIAMDDRRNQFPSDALLECRVRGVQVTDLLCFLERETGKVNLDVLQPGWLIYSSGFRRGIYHTVMKRCSDLAAASLLFLLMAPLMLITALAIFLEGRGIGQILYRQRRVGYEGKQFDALKFRSMVVDAEQDGRPRWASTDDDRITRVGAVIRRFHIDELPQIINVLRGEMSFVGPRPERPEFVNELAARIPFYLSRFCVKPGITGWAQLCSPYAASVEDARRKLQYDLFYVKNHGLAFDILILLQTLEVVLWGRTTGVAGSRRRSPVPAAPDRLRQRKSAGCEVIARSVEEIE